MVRGEQGENTLDAREVPRKRKEGPRKIREVAKQKNKKIER